MTLHSNFTSPIQHPQSSMHANYAGFLAQKSQTGIAVGIKPVYLPEFLFPVQHSLIDWALWQGRAAILADCGLGKTIMELVWAENIVRHTGKNVLIAAPLAVSHQIVREAGRFGISARRSVDGTAHRGITITNYERLGLFNSADFAGFVGDESSILKSFDGARRREITAFMRHLPYRLLATATAAPNDYVELGTTSEALGQLGHVDMLNRFFTNKNNNSAQRRARGEDAEWRFKGHAEASFWRWVSSWARALRRPSDLGFEDGGFVLPPLIEQECIVESASQKEGCLFSLPAVGLQEQREEKHRTLKERCDAVAALVNHTGKPAFVGCHLNAEGDLLAELIPDAVQVKGSDSDDAKEARLTAFADGNARVLITKDRIGGWGLNFQHCNHVTRFPSHSFEAHYQWVRRCWRYGQTRPVTVDIVASEGERGILRNLQRKSAQADQMFASLVAAMSAHTHIDRTIRFPETEVLPSWLS